MKLRNGSRFRSLSTKSFSVYSGPLSAGGRLDALADATGAVRLGGGGGRPAPLLGADPPHAAAMGSAAKATSGAKRAMGRLTFHPPPPEPGRLAGPPWA